MTLTPLQLQQIRLRAQWDADLQEVLTAYEEAQQQLQAFRASLLSICLRMDREQADFGPHIVGSALRDYLAALSDVVASIDARTAHSAHAHPSESSR